MAKAIYLGVDGKARKMKKAYIGIDGKAHKIKKVYTGVDGKAKLAYTSYTPVTGITLSWSIRDPYYVATAVGSGEIAPGSANIYATVSPAEATNKKLTWSISGGCSITSSSDTRCSVRAGGSSYLTVTSTDGASARIRIDVAYQRVTVERPNASNYHYLSGYTYVITSISRL